MMVSTGAVFSTASGRRMAPAPKVDASADRRQRNSIDRIDAWLREEAIREAEAKGCGYQASIARGIRIGNLSRSDRDTLHHLLFGEAMEPPEALAGA